MEQFSIIVVIIIVISSSSILLLVDIIDLIICQSGHSWKTSQKILLHPTQEGYAYECHNNFSFGNIKQNQKKFCFFKSFIKYIAKRHEIKVVGILVFVFHRTRFWQKNTMGNFIATFLHISVKTLWTVIRPILFIW